jgi:ribosomal-protein-alanine N-acetyltransferase
VSGPAGTTKRGRTRRDDSPTDASLLPGPARASISLGTQVVTDRLVLRAFRSDDVRALRAFAMENADHLRAWSPRPSPGASPTSLVDLASKIASARKDWRADRGYQFAGFDRRPAAAGRQRPPLVARVSLNNVVRGVFQNAYLGYMIAESHQGLGLAREAVRAVIEFAFRTAELHRIQAAIMPHNERSLRLVRALGFREEGRAQGYLMIDGAWRDHLVFAMTREDWPPARER